jgi:mercuric ion transport protein
MDRFRRLAGGFVGAGGALLASACCLLPLTIVALGLGSGAFMATTMPYSPVFIPTGGLAVLAGFVFYRRERRRCAAAACRLIGGRLTLTVLIAAAIVVAAALVLYLLPELTADLLTRAMAGSAPSARSGHQ